MYVDYQACHQARLDETLLDRDNRALIGSLLENYSSRLFFCDKLLSGIFDGLPRSNVFWLPIWTFVNIAQFRLALDQQKMK